MQKLVAIEGVDGVGKTTVLKALSESLQKENIQFILTKEPGGPKALRQEWCSLLHPFGPDYDGFRDLCVNNPQIPQLAKRALYKADSFYNWLAVTKPALEKNQLVLSDRSWISDLAYGKVLANLSIESLFQFNMALVPEQRALTKCIYLDCPEDVREARLAANIADEADKIGRSKRNEITETYMLVLEKYVDEYFVINTNDSIENIVKTIKNNCLQ